MKGNRKYLILMVLLAVAAVVFGVTGTVAPSAVIFFVFGCISAFPESAHV